MKKVQIKMKCSSVTDHGTVKSVILNPIYGVSEEGFLTPVLPSSQRELSIEKDASEFDFFKAGAIYVMTFEESV